MIRKSFAILLSFILLTACGWHLRGNLTLPQGLNRVYLDDEADGEPLLNAVEELLTANDVEIAKNPAAAQLTIRLLSYDEERRVVAVGGNTLVTEYELVDRGSFSVADGQGQVLLPASDLSVVRSYQFDRNNVLGMEQEERLIQEEMRRELAQQIIRRLRFADLDGGR